MDFKRLTTDIYSHFNRYFKNQPYDLCVYNLPSLIVWTNTVSQHYALERDDMLILYIDYPKVDIERHLIMPVSLNHPLPPEKLVALADEFGFSTYQYIPGEYMVENRSQLASYFKIEEQPEYSDYLYKTKDLAYLRGNKYSKKRNLIHQFEKDFVEKDRVVVEPLVSSKADEYLSFLQEWCDERDCQDDADISLKCEKEAIVKALHNLEKLDFKGLCLRIDGVINAFGVASKLNDRMGILMFEKAFTRVKGLYQYFDRTCARRLFRDFTYINKESDMGIPGITKAKRSYHPVGMTTSYKLTRV